MGLKGKGKREGGADLTFHGLAPEATDQSPPAAAEGHEILALWD
jgi:hypothetical protein